MAHTTNTRYVVPRPENCSLDVFIYFTNNKSIQCLYIRTLTKCFLVWFSYVMRFFLTYWSSGQNFDCGYIWIDQFTLPYQYHYCHVLVYPQNTVKSLMSACDNTSPPHQYNACITSTYYGLYSILHVYIVTVLLLGECKRSMILVYRESLDIRGKDYSTNS